MQADSTGVRAVVQAEQMHEFTDRHRSFRSSHAAEIPLAGKGESNG